MDTGAKAALADCGLEMVAMQQTAAWMESWTGAGPTLGEDWPRSGLETYKEVSDTIGGAVHG